MSGPESLHDRTREYLSVRPVRLSTVPGETVRTPCDD